eukprot:6512758-Pyramimonas_sp.AAC.1
MKLIRTLPCEAMQVPTIEDVRRASRSFAWKTGLGADAMPPRADSLLVDDAVAMLVYLLWAAGGLGTMAHHHHGHSCDAVGEAPGWLQTDSLAPLHLQGVYQDQDRPRAQMGGQPHASILRPGLRAIYD